MAFSNLSESLQNVILYNFDAFGKAFLILLLVGLSAYYVFYHRPHIEKKTIYLSIAIVRTLFYIFALAMLIFLLPFSLFFISPEYTLQQFYSLFMIFWIMIFSLWLIVFTVDFFRYGFLGILALGNLDIGDRNAKEWAENIKKGKFFNFKY